MSEAIFPFKGKKNWIFFFFCKTVQWWKNYDEQLWMRSREKYYTGKEREDYLKNGKGYCKRSKVHPHCMPASAPIYYVPTAHTEFTENKLLKSAESVQMLHTVSGANSLKTFSSPQEMYCWDSSLCICMWLKVHLNNTHTNTLIIVEFHSWFTFHAVSSSVTRE